MEPERAPHQPRRRSFVTDAYLRVARGRDSVAELGEDDRRRLLKWCYLWPLSGVAVFMPLVVYVQYRRHEELGPHARQSMLLALGYSGTAFSLGLSNGFWGRILSDWVLVALLHGGVLLASAAVLTGLGMRWYQLAVQHESVEIPWVSRLADRL